jgi:hypothetical protein
VADITSTPGSTPMPAALALRIVLALECALLWTEGSEARARVEKALTEFHAWRTAGAAAGSGGDARAAGGTDA